jgi:hypothetical protein
MLTAMSEIHSFNQSAMATPFQVRCAGEEKNTPRLHLTQLIAGGGSLKPRVF